MAEQGARVATFPVLDGLSISRQRPGIRRFPPHSEWPCWVVGLGPTRCITGGAKRQE